MGEILLKQEVYSIIGAAITVHQELGAGFLEAVYQEALEIELHKRNIPFISQKRLSIYYKGSLLKKQYKVDLLCYEGIIVELKALNQLSPINEAQLLNYLKATHLRVGVLINFGSVGKLEWKRFVK